MKGNTVTGFGSLCAAGALLFSLILVAATPAATPRAAAERIEATEARPADADASPLTNEDVVRMVASGMATERILQRIASSPARFDVETDIVEELRVAGVPEEIIRAMTAKARAESARTPPAAPAPPLAAAEKNGWIEVVFDDDPNGTPASNSVMLPTALGDPNVSSARRKVDFAFFVICTHPLHAPNLWMSATPLAEEIGRHQALFFHEGTAPATGEKEKDSVYLEHPDRWRFPAEAGEHAGLAGVAMRAGGEGKFVPVVAAPYKSLKVEAGAVTRIEIRLRSRVGRVAPRGQEEARSRLEELNFTNIGNTGKAGARTTSTVEIVAVSPPAPEAAAPVPEPKAPPHPP